MKYGYILFFLLAVSESSRQIKLERGCIDTVCEPTSHIQRKIGFEIGWGNVSIRNPRRD